MAKNKDAEHQLKIERDAVLAYVLELKEQLRQEDAIIRLIVRCAPALEEEARKLSDDVPF